jgi:hypothetical protein
MNAAPDSPAPSLGEFESRNFFGKSGRGAPFCLIGKMIEVCFGRTAKF